VWRYTEGVGVEKNEDAMTRSVPPALLPAALPLVGEAHPLRRGYAAVLRRGTTTAVLFHVCVFLTWYTAATLVRRAPEIRPELVFTITNPPSITGAKPPQVGTIDPPVEIGRPIPVDDFLAPPVEFPTNAVIGGLLDPPWDAGAGDGTGGNVVFKVPESAPRTETPTSLEVVEVMPRLLSLPAPGYPEIARLAEVEGMVLLQVLVGKDGRVAQVRVVQSVPMLDDAAIAAARQAVFAPALQQGRPVAVWVEVPIQFRLN
jgi:TonB family protein